MKLTAVFLLVGCLHLSAASYSQTITLEAKEYALKDVFGAIQKQTDYHVVYNVRFLEHAAPVTISAKQMPLEAFLAEVLTDQALTYDIREKTILIGRSKVKPTLPSNQNTARAFQERVVTGQVTDESGNPLAGVTVTGKGTPFAVTTDGDGRYRIQIPDNVSTLVFTNVGFEVAERMIGNQKEIMISLTTSMSDLDEVIVVGYGTQRKRHITGAISSLSATDIADQPLTTLDGGLVGKLPGVQVSQPTGIPGGGVTVRIRGTGSLGAGNEPLYVIDGFPVYAGYDQTDNPMAGINPNDIAYMEVLKDASATAIYGSRGANGVIIITTKSGQAGATRINFDIYSGFNEVSKKLDLLNAREYAEYIVESRNNGWVASGPGRSPADPNNVRGSAVYQILPGLENPMALGVGTDWQDEVFRKGAIQNYQVNFSGGTDKTNYFVSGGYHRTNGVIINSDFERYSFRVNIESQVAKRFKLGTHISPSYTFNNVVDSEGHFGNGAVVLSALLMPPHLSPRNTDGSYVVGGNFGHGLSGIQNPVMTAMEEKNQRGSFRMLGTSFLEWEILQDLRLKTAIGADLNTARRNAFVPSTVDIGGVANGTSGTSQSINWLNENTLSYTRGFGLHYFDAVVGYTLQKERFESNFVSATNYPNDLVSTINAGTVNGGSSGLSEWSLMSYLGRINYAFDNKYLVSIAYRRDGSSRFGDNNKWGAFPSASIGWIVSEESFLQPVTWLANLKIRASYGVTGNNNIGNYDHIALLSDRNYVLGSGNGALVNGLYPNRVPNPNLGWETNTQFNIGLDMGFLQNRISLIADFYDKRTSDMLLQVPVPTLTGYGTARQNIGKLKNVGWEIGVSSRNLVKVFQWSTELNVSVNKNEVLALGPTNAPIFASYDLQNVFMTEVGKPLGNYYGYQVVGVYLDDADLEASPRFADSRAGHLKFADVDVNGSLNTNDRTILGNPFPDFIWGVTNNFTYKGVDLAITVQGSVGGERMHLGRRFYGNYAGTANALRDVLNRWKSPQDPGDGQTPLVSRDLGRYSSSNSSANLSSKFIEDASYMRIRSISLGYELPQQLANKLYSKRLRVYANAQNMITFTNYTGFNPEVSLVGHSTLTPGIDYGTYPLPRTYTLGINLIF